MVIDLTSVLVQNGANYRQFPKGILFESGIALNGVASDIFVLIDGQKTIKEIASTISSSYETNLDIVSADIIALAKTLLEEGLIEIHE